MQDDYVSGCYAQLPGNILLFGDQESFVLGVMGVQRCHPEAALETPDIPIQTRGFMLTSPRASILQSVTVFTHAFLRSEAAETSSVLSRSKRIANV
jgi:hypothetical protein